MKQEMMKWQRHQLDHMQIITCTSLQPEPRQHLIAQGRLLFLTPSQQCQRTEGSLYCTKWKKNNASAIGLA